MTTPQPSNGASVGNAVAKRDNSPAGLVREYTPDFATMLPSHIRPDQWARLAIGALRRDPKLAQAAQNDPGVFLAQLGNAARLGLEPGTEQFYLTVRKERGVDKVLGVPGYQGLIELIYRAGAVASVIAEVVYSGDEFDYVPGRDERPRHIIDWDAPERGDLRLAYAYAVMKDGATSKVIVLNRHDITRIKSSSQGASSQYSPWQTNPAAMWLKSAVRQLAKWVPTSAEYRREQLRAAQEVYAETQAKAAAESRIPAAPAAADGEYVDEVTGEVFAQDPPDDDVHDAELVDEDHEQVSA
ncbi:MAG: recombinase RecT [Propionicimonas sp.]|nr:recombinase RecT [Propionicimonas sp.]